MGLARLYKIDRHSKRQKWLQSGVAADTVNSNLSLLSKAQTFVEGRRGDWRIEVMATFGLINEVSFALV